MICNNKKCNKSLSKKQIGWKQKHCSVNCWKDVKSETADILPSGSLCLNCKKDISGFDASTRMKNGIKHQRKFCSRSCAAINNNAIRKNQPKLNKKINLIKCENCNILFRKIRSNFCSSNCKSEKRMSEIILIWQSGNNSVVSMKSGILKRSVANWIKEQVDYRCDECGIREFHPTDGGPAVQIDHIDGDRYNNDWQNLRVLCVWCHWKTPTYGARNSGKYTDEQTDLRRKKKAIN